MINHFYMMRYLFQLALAGNLIITVGKFLAYLHSGSSAMSSEAMHSLVDSANQLLLVVGLRSAATAPDKRHQYGYGEDAMLHRRTFFQTYS